MGILNNIEDVLQSMDSYTIKMRIYNQMVRNAETTLENLGIHDPSWYYHTTIRTVVVELVNNTFYEEHQCKVWVDDPPQLILPRRCKVIRIKRLFQLDDNEIDILIKADICKIVDDRIYFDDRFINELKVYILERVNA